MKFMFVAALSATMLFATALEVPRAQPSSARISPDDWATYNRTLAGDRFSPLDQITAANVRRLRQLCTFDTGEQVSFQTGPVVVNGAMYFTTDTITYAIDAATCALKWKQPHPHGETFLKASRGLAFDNGRLFRGADSGHVIALDAQTGQTLWDVEVSPVKPGVTLPMAPIAWNGHVYIGNAGGDMFGVTGHVWSLDETDGRTAWRFDVVPESGPALASWQNAPDLPITGGAFWTTFALDASQSVLYVPSGNPAPDFLPEVRPGDNLYTDSVIALDAATGRLLAYNQLVKHDFHDWDVSAGPVVLTTRGGLQLVASANKDGLLAGLDRSTVRREAVGTSGGSATEPLGTLPLKYQTPTTTRANVDVRLTADAAVRFCPGAQGGSEWNGPAYDPRSNLIFVGATDWCTSVQALRPDTLVGKPGGMWLGAVGEGAGVQDPKDKMQGWLTAFDADRGTVSWKYRSPMPILAGVTPTAGGVIFTGELNGDAIALDAKSGKVLWRHPTNNAIGGGVLTYRAGGRQLVAVAAGMKSLIWPVPAQTNRIVVFGL